MKQNFLQKLLALTVLLAAMNVNASNITVSSDITTHTIWVNTNNYILYGDIIVKNGATLTIESGTIVRGDKATLSRLVVATGAKIIAQGTPEQPIVFTSNQPAGLRSRGDWAGLAICGLAPVNFKDGGGNPIQGRIECGTTTDYDFGGSFADDSSGVLSYVRIEYAGYVCGSNSELNSLTMGGVGNKTKIDHVMVTYGQDDGFEWFGGTVNATHLISFGSRDDDFDTDNGFSGQVQFGLVIRADTIADQGDISNAFESDNDANGTYNFPYTRGVFSNITVVGPAQTTASSIDPKYGWALRLRRNTGLNVFNSVFIGYKRGLRIEGTAAQTKAAADTLEFKNNIIAGCKEQYYEAVFDSLYLLNQPTNTIFSGNANDTVQLVYPYGNPDLFNFTPQTGSPALSGASFSNQKLAGLTSTNYRGAFDHNNNWATCWAEFTPQDEDYTAGPVNYSPAVNISQSGSLPSLTLTADNIAGAIYNWSTGGNSPSVTVSAAGTYTVTVTTARGCTKTQSVTVTPTGINSISTLRGISLTPNPNKGLANLQISVAEITEATITVTDITGKEIVVLNKELAGVSNTISINTSHFANGIYFVTVRNKSENKVVRMAVNK